MFMSLQHKAPDRNHQQLPGPDPFYCWWNYQLIDHLRRLNILIMYKLVPPNSALFDVLQIQLIGDAYDQPNNDMFECHML